jgi:chemotaxis protein methyltransferase CheR
MEDFALKRISDLINHHSGILIRDQDYKSLAEKVGRRLTSLGLGSLHDYCDRLLTELEANPSSPMNTAGSSLASSEWQELYSILTINESYFFRDSNQFRLLSDRLLPEILSRKQTLAGEHLGSKPRLRIWSAGCSTGEELYSIAIALNELNFPWDQWDTALIGTDISPTAVESARRGVYGPWSFRQTEAKIQQKYFDPHHQLYQICDRLRQRVEFHWGNLLDEPSPSLTIGLTNIDLILCRNVFIYLDSTAIGRIIQKFHRMLAPQGYLLTGHTELYGQDTSQFQITSLPESLVYQKLLGPGQSLSQAEAMPTILPPRKACAIPPRARLTQTPSCLGQMAPSASKTHHKNNTLANQKSDLQQAIEAAEAALKQEFYTSAIQQAEKLLSLYPKCDAAGKIVAHAYANQGIYSKAKQVCQQVLSRDPLSIDMIYLLAQIAEDQNDPDLAKAYLRKIIYLDTNFVKAYLDLASIYEREKQTEKTQKMRSQALALLAKLPPESLLDDYSHPTVAQWQEHLGKPMVL